MSGRRPYRAWAALCGIAMTGSASTAQDRSEADWTIGAPVTPLSGPQHFVLGPNANESNPGRIAPSKLLPSRLVEIDVDAIVATSGAPPRIVPRGTQLFRVSRTKVPVFCTLEPGRRQKFDCLADMNGDGLLDASVDNKTALIVPPVLFPNAGAQTPLASPVAVRPVDPAQCRCDLTISIQYIGRRKFTKRDASFVLAVQSDKQAATSRNFELDLDALPSTYTIAGARFENIRREGKLLHLDLTSNLASGPFDVQYEPRGIEWGF